MNKLGQHEKDSYSQDNFDHISFSRLQSLETFLEAGLKEGVRLEYDRDLDKFRLVTKHAVFYNESLMGLLDLFHESQHEVDTNDV